MSKLFIVHPPLVRWLVGLIAIFSVSNAFSEESIVQNQVDRPAFFARCDMVWEQLPRQWNEGAFVGNGQLGLMVHETPADNRIDFHVGRVDVTDHRKAPDRKTSRGVRGAGVMFDFCRLDVGRMALRPAGKIQSGSMRVDLWNAELTCLIKTDLGELRLRAVTLHDRMVNVIDVKSTEVDAGGRAVAWKWEFLPGNPASPRRQVFPTIPESKAYVTNPGPVMSQVDGVPVCVQTLLAGGDYATAWLDVPGIGRSSRLLLTTANEVPKSGTSARVAVDDLRRAAELKGDDLLVSHRAWWHDYFSKTFLTIPDARMEQFYWIQMYKLASASRPDAPPMDNLGPFFRVSQWPGLWWNLNVQIAYWPAYTGNRLELSTNLIDEIDTNFDGLFQTFSGSAKLGDFAWVMHNYWLQYRFAGDWKSVVEKWMPKARRVAADYGKFLHENAGGQLELSPMESPEYHGFEKYENANYNLALLRWLLSSLIEADTHTGVAPDPDRATWQRTLDRLVPFSVDANGLMIGSDQSVDQSHRHFSHLMALYPLFQLDPDSPQDRELVVRSVKHWHHIEGGKSLAGYSFTGGACLYAALGMGDEAYDLLHTFLTGDIGISELLCSTMYVESGGKNPVIETPLSGSAAVMELLLQSWGGKIRVFPATPSAWRDATFENLRGIGGFVVSAARHGGRTQWVRITSEAGEPLVLKIADWTGPVDVTGSAGSAIEIAPGEYQIPLEKGQAILVRARGSVVAPVVRDLPVPDDQKNLYGLKRGKELKTIQAWPEVPIENEVKR